MDTARKDGLPATDASDAVFLRLQMTADLSDQRALRV